MTISVTATVATTYAPAVLVDVVSSPSVSAPLKVYRVHDDGSRHRVLTDGRAVLVGSWSGYDYHAPLNRTFTYVAAAEGQPESAESSVVFLPSEDAWMVHATDPVKSFPIVKVLAGSQSQVTYQGTATEYAILNSALPVVRTDSPRSGAVGHLNVKVPAEDVAAALELFKDGGPLLFNGAWGSVDYPWMWINAKDLVVANPGPIGFPFRTFSFDFRECRAPDADVVPTWTLDDVAAAFTDLNAVAAAYSDLRALQLDIRNP